ncbi:MAG: helix-turn-helix domain-containing protein [Gracilimonas sp.]|nr:helix-turn-helix domain-containing protein [Gracilimonas sp.]
MSLGKDLASIRKSKNITIEDVQNAIKIPLDILTSIEDDSIFSDPNRNKTYLRSFVRSYAKLLKIDDEDIVQALDEVEAGTYSGNIFPESKKDTPPIDIEDKKESDNTTREKSSKKEPVEVSPSQVNETASQSPEINSINWADIGSKFSTASRYSRIWIIAIFVIVILGLAGTGYYFWNNFSTSEETPEPEIVQQDVQEDQTIPIPPPTADTTSTETPAAPTQNQPVNETEEPSTEPIVLDDTITVTLYAAYGQLEPVRVTSDLNWRTNPFWMEEGEAYKFDFRDTLLVRGQYSRLLLLFNDHVIENPRQNHFSPSFNSILLTRDILDQPNYLSPPPDEFPLEVGPPDSSVYRIRF